MASASEDQPPYETSYTSVTLVGNRVRTGRVRTIEHERYGYWEFFSNEDKMSTYKLGIVNPEGVLAREAKEPNSTVHIKLRWVSGRLDTYLGARDGNARLHLAVIEQEYHNLGLPALSDSRVPLYPIDREKELLEYRAQIWRSSINNPWDTYLATSSQDVPLSKYRPEKTFVGVNSPSSLTVNSKESLGVEKPGVHSPKPSSEASLRAKQAPARSFDSLMDGQSFVDVQQDDRLATEATSSTTRRSSSNSTTEVLSPGQHRDESDRKRQIGYSPPTYSSNNDSTSQSRLLPPPLRSSIDQRNGGRHQTPYPIYLTSEDEMVPFHMRYFNRGLSSPSETSESISGSYTTAKQLPETNRPLEGMPEDHDKSLEGSMDKGVHNDDEDASFETDQPIAPPASSMQMSRSHDHTTGEFNVDEDSCEETGSQGIEPSAVPPASLMLNPKPGDVTGGDASMQDSTKETGNSSKYDWSGDDLMKVFVLPHELSVPMDLEAFNEADLDAYAHIPCMDCGHVGDHGLQCAFQKISFQEQPNVLQIRDYLDATKRNDPGPWTTHRSLQQLQVPELENYSTVLDGMLNIIKNEEDYKSNPNLHDASDDMLPIFYALGKSNTISCEMHQIGGKDSEDWYGDIREDAEDLIKYFNSRDSGPIGDYGSGN
ncbi:hypothetical protein BS50DRAFT_630982 [Corynespora cassiicola Philippines]|uniref:Uncharacterized protein n=1 Tax=Corynespora cassiicola Philippines TaxID=1448308 RepID=A0A2T2NZY5_CORCC|nr:hypothetical protein BS50DRAFT_630982 [Corynespora cassiicola Philippines]